MKNHYIKIFMLACASAALFSCNKQLNVYPTTSEVDGNVITDTKSASTVLNGVYYRYANAGVDVNSVPSVLWTGPNEIIPSELANSLVNSSGNDNVYTITLTSSSGAPTTEWNYGYNVVNAANGFLKNIDPVTTIPAAAKTQMIAEGRFLRACGNAHLLLYFGQYYDPSSKYGIILRTEPITADNINRPRSSVADAYTSILADLDVAIAGLPTLNTQIYYANAWVAKLMKARVLINRGAAGDYAQVISLTNDIITNSPFLLETNVKDLFYTKAFTSKEVMLGLQPYPTETYKFRQNQYYTQYPVSDTMKSALKNDARNTWYYQNIVLRGNTVGQLTKYYSGNPTTITQTTFSETCYAFRLTEAYLLEAEAIALSNGDLAKAKTLLATVMARAGNNDFTQVNNATTGTALQVLVVKEELKSLMAENGADWFALRRLPLATIQTIQPNIKNINQLILPVPLAEITSNGTIIQNPNY